MIAPRSEEVRPVEMVVRVDILPEPAAISRMGVFAAALGEDDDGSGERDMPDQSSPPDVPPSVDDIPFVEGSAVSEAAEEEHSFNF